MLIHVYCICSHISHHNAHAWVNDFSNCCFYFLSDRGQILRSDVADIVKKLGDEVKYKKAEVSFTSHVLVNEFIYACKKF